LPKYSPWFMPMEKVFLITHMRCSARMAWTRADFTRRVIDVLHAEAESPPQPFTSEQSEVDEI
ncbi:MAG: hypothetical protein ACPHQR_06385, partial [Candidatus Poseidoniaceae archaeon]